MGAVKRVRISGIGKIEYADSTTPEKRFNREPAYQAEVEDSGTGKRLTIFVAWACANGCISSTRYEGDFTVEPYEKDGDNVVHVVLLADAKEVTSFGASAYDPNQDPTAILLGHTGSRVGAAMAGAAVEAFSTGGKRHWKPAPMGFSEPVPTIAGQ